MAASLRFVHEAIRRQKRWLSLRQYVDKTIEDRALKRHNIRHWNDMNEAMERQKAKPVWQLDDGFPAKHAVLYANSSSNLCSTL